MRRVDPVDRVLSEAASISDVRVERGVVGDGVSIDPSHGALLPVISTSACVW